MCFTMHYTFRSSVGRWRHKIRKFAVEIFQNINNRPQSLCQIFRMVAIEIVINSTCGALHSALHAAGIALTSS